MQFKIVWDISFSSLEKQVYPLIREGWNIQGGVGFVTDENTISHYYQVLIRQDLNIKE